MNRGRPRTPWSDYIKTRVMQNGPVKYNDLLNDAAALVPPGQGYRRYKAIFEASRQRQGKPPLTEAEAGKLKHSFVMNGKRHIIRATLNSFTRSGRITMADGYVKAGPKPWGDGE